MEQGPGQNWAWVAVRVGTSWEGDAMILIPNVHQLDTQDTHRIVLDAEALAGALRMSKEGGRDRDGIHLLYASVLQGEHVRPRSTINNVTYS